MPKLKKANRIIEVTDSQVDGYLKRGYDLIDDNGRILKHATGGRTVSLAEYNKALEEIERLKEELKKAKKGGGGGKKAAKNDDNQKAEQTDEQTAEQNGEDK